MSKHRYRNVRYENVSETAQKWQPASASKKKCALPW